MWVVAQLTQKRTKSRQKEVFNFSENSSKFSRLGEGRDAHTQSVCGKCGEGEPIKRKFNKTQCVHIIIPD